MPDPVAALIGSVSAVEWTIVGTTVFFAGFLRGFVGFGGAMVIILVLSVVLGPLVAVPVAAISGLPTTFQLLPSAFRHGERGFILRFGATSFLLAPLGTLVLITLPPSIMKIAIALFVLIMVAMLYRGWQPRRGGDANAYAGGAAAGLVQGASGVGGPPAVAIALSRPGTPQQQRGNVIGAVTSLSFCNLVPMWWHGLFTVEIVILGIAIVPIYVGSTWLGGRFFTAQGQRHYRNAALLALAIVGMVTLGVAMKDYLSG